MKKRHFNSLPEFSETQNINVDRENSILKGVEIAKFGKNKNESYFNAQFLADLVEHGNAQTQGVKCRFGHPAMCGTALGTYIGRYKNHSLKENKVYADLHLDPISKKTQVEGKGITMYDYIMDMAEANPDMFGNSIVIDCTSFDEQIKNEKGEGEIVDSLILSAYVASDLVDDPAATDALFSSNPDDLGVIVSNFLDTNPKIFDVIEKNPNIIGDFFERYANYSNRNPNQLNMKFSFDKFKKAFSSESFNIDLTLADGSIVQVVTEAEEAAVGDQVNDAEGKAVGKGEHLLPDGNSIITDEKGVITELKDKPEEDPTPEGIAEVMNSVNALTKKFDTFLTSQKAIQDENESAFGVIQQAFSSLDKKVMLMGKNITSKKPEDFDTTKPDGRTNVKSSGYDADKAKEQRTKSNK